LLGFAVAGCPPGPEPTVDESPPLCGVLPELEPVLEILEPAVVRSVVAPLSRWESARTVPPASTSSAAARRLSLHTTRLDRGALCWGRRPPVSCGAPATRCQRAARVGLSKSSDSTRSPSELPASTLAPQFGHRRVYNASTPDLTRIHHSSASLTSSPTHGSVYSSAVIT
jgi:hypothetical protein